MIMRKRLGVSIVEVMFAIGVVAVGLLGMIAIFPVALDQIGRGSVSDRSFRFGQNSTETFLSHGMHRIINWRFPTVRAGTGPLNSMAATATPGVNTQLSPLPSGLGINAVVPVTCWCIDPLFVAANLAVPTYPTGNAYPNRDLDPDVFPYQQIPQAARTYPTFRRVSLSAIWAGIATPPAAPPIMRQAAAELLFSLNDELVFNVPAESTLAPEQSFLVDGTGINAKRLAEGTISWFATLAPVATTTATLPPRYYLTTVIVHRRHLRVSDPVYYASTPAVVENVRQESMATIAEADFHTGGLQGGDVTLTALTAADLDIRPGQWVMLMRNWVSQAAPAAPSAPGAPVPIARWYRVVGAERQPRNVAGNTWQLDLTLNGPDWALDPGLPLLPRQPATQVAIVRGVTEVFEREIHVE